MPSSANAKLKSEFRVKPGEETRLDRFLAERFPGWSRTALQKLINKRGVMVDEHPASPNHKLKVGQSIRIAWPKPQARAVAAVEEAPPFPILFEDDAFIAINKPPGLVVHPSAGHFHGRTLVELLAPRIAKGPWPDENRPGLVHRLDRDTSGVILLAKTPEAHARLSKQFAGRHVKKTYWAIAKGAFDAAQGTLECHIARHPGQRLRFAVAAAGRWASTEFRVVEAFGRQASLLELNPLTGRTHQIRVQLAGYGHPILGDELYGGIDADFGVAHRQMLHAEKIAFRHPETNEPMTISAPLPADFQETLKVLRSRPQ